MTVIFLEQTKLIESFKQLKPFMSNEATRYYICGIYCVKVGSSLTLVATNGHILGEKVIQLDNSEGEDFAFILGRKAVCDMLKIMGKEKEALVKFSYNRETRQITFDAFEFKYSCAEIDGKYPDYSKVIPDTKKKLNLPAANSTYIKAALDAIGANQFIDIGFIDESSPFLMNTADKDPDFKCVIMPVRAGLCMDKDEQAA